ncbi:MAG TPA: hypothetical protein VE684_03625 [Crenalkalicoccus sp.]|jgi:hypothetical protein|nr:hypothetical protein [Crenalkalicoccus sp.]
MRDASRQHRRAQLRVLGLAIAWMMALQFACILAWEAGLLGRQGALVHWLLLGVLPPALALWTSRPEA